jgi:hypothetical protein
MLPPKPVQRLFGWYFTRIYVKVRPERVYVWEGGECTSEPLLLDAHLEEVRSGHDEEPERPPPEPVGGRPKWDARMDELGERYPTAVLSLLSPDGFPFSARVPIALDKEARRVRLDAEPMGAPLMPCLACLTAHDHAPDFTWQRNFQVRGDLVEEDGGWALVPHKLVGGFEIPPTSMFERYRLNAKKIRRFRKIAKREKRRRG